MYTKVNKGMQVAHLTSFDIITYTFKCISTIYNSYKSASGRRAQRDANHGSIIIKSFHQVGCHNLYFILVSGRLRLHPKLEVLS